MSPAPTTTESEAQEAAKRGRINMEQIGACHAWDAWNAWLDRGVCVRVCACVYVCACVCLYVCVCVCACLRMFV